MTNGLRTVFWLHALAAFVFGVGYLFAPAFVAGVFDVDAGDLFVTRLYGVATLALGVASVLAALATTYEQVDIVLRMEVFYTVAATLVCLYSIFFLSAAPITWLAVGLFGVLALLFGYCAWQTRAQRRAEPGTPALR